MPVSILTRYPQRCDPLAYRLRGLRDIVPHDEGAYLLPTDRGNADLPHGKRRAMCRLAAPRGLKPRRHALLLAVIRQARGQVLDDLTQMLLKLVGRMESKSTDRLQES